MSSDGDIEAARAGGGGGAGGYQMEEIHRRNSQPPAAARRSRDGKPEYKLAGLPRLDYNILHYKTKLFIVTGLLLFEGSIAPVILYYALSLGTSLREGISEYS